MPSILRLRVFADGRDHRRRFNGDSLIRRSRLNWRNRLATVFVGMLLIVGSAVPAKAPASWDGLVLVQSKRLDLVYLEPGADFRGYSKIIVEPTEIAFAKNWQRDHNSGTRSLSSRVSNHELRDAIARGLVEASDIFSESWTRGGYAVVTEPGADVLRVKTSIVNIRVSAPDRPTAGRSHSFAGEAGSATLFVEARDSMTGALLGRAVDQEIAGDNTALWRTAVSNRADFRNMVENWATISVRGVSELKTLSPIQP